MISKSILLKIKRWGNFVGVLIMLTGITQVILSVGISLPLVITGLIQIFLGKIIIDAKGYASELLLIESEKYARPVINQLINTFAILLMIQGIWYIIHVIQTIVDIESLFNFI